MAPPPAPPATRRNPWLLGGVAGFAVIATVLNYVGLSGFPYNAPVEGFYALGICVDLIAIAIACGIGAGMAARRRFRPGSRVIAILAFAFAAVALAVWAIAGGVSSIVQLLTERGRYMDATGGLFLTGALWSLSAIFAAFTVRRDDRAGRGFAIGALAIVGVLVAYAVVSSVIYGMALTD